MSQSRTLSIVPGMSAAPAFTAPPPTVDGRTRIFQVLGDPVAQVKAPSLFNPLFQRHGLNALLVPAHVAPEHFASYVRGTLLARNIDGLWLTVPHKAAALALVDELDEQAQRAGAINAIRREADGRLTGALFDGVGLSKALDHVGMSPEGRHVLLVGIGGAGMAIAAALSQRRLASLTLFDRNPQRAHKVVERLQLGALTPVRATESVDPAGFDLVVHATPLGLKSGDPLPFDVNRLKPSAQVFDIVMTPTPTPLLQACAQRGIAAQAGFEMLTQQVPEYLSFFGYQPLAEALAQDLSPIRPQFETAP